jgi:hypothetical protein
MKQYTIGHIDLVVDRIAVAWIFLCVGTTLGLFIASCIPPTFLSQRLNFLWLSFAVIFALIWLPSLLFMRSSFGKRYQARIARSVHPRSSPSSSVISGESGVQE